MKSIFYKILFFFPIFFLANSLLAQKIEADRSKIERRSFEKTKLDRYKKQRRFDYFRKRPEQTESVWEKIMRWIRNTFFRPLESKSLNNLRTFIYYAIFATILVFIILRALKAGGVSIFYNKKKAKVQFTESEENIHLIDFDKEISQAISQNLLTRAVRLWYLKVLKKLDDTELILWSIDKTNYEYWQEIQNEDLKQKFRDLTYFFEYVHYGDFEINNQNFDEVKRSFETFYGQISNLKLNTV